jgi:hypothetical protein
MILNPMGCSQRQGGVQETKVNMLSTQPAKDDPWADSSAPKEEKELFKTRVATNAQVFAQKSESIYKGQKPKKSIWEILWPWGKKKDEKPKMSMDKFKFSATYPNQKK